MRQTTKSAADYTFSEALDALPIRNEEDVQLSWMPDSDFLSEKETNSVIGEYLPSQVRKNGPSNLARTKKAKAYAGPGMNYDDYSFSQAMDAVDQLA